MRDMENKIVGVEQKIFMIEQGTANQNRFWQGDFNKLVKANAVKFNDWLQEKHVELDSLHN